MVKAKIEDKRAGSDSFRSNDRLKKPDQAQTCIGGGQPTLATCKVRKARMESLCKDDREKTAAAPGSVPEPSAGWQV